jgi:hypothetical protein
MKNYIEVDTIEFKLATKVFSRKRLKLGRVLLAYENGILTIESGEVTAVMRAKGEWHGRATFSPQIMRALAVVPPTQSPIVITYVKDHLLIAGMKIICKWHSVSRAFIHNLENPGILDLLAMERSLPRIEIMRAPIGKEIRKAIKLSEQRIMRAAIQLEDLEVTEADIRDIVKLRINRRLVNSGDC